MFYRVYINVLHDDVNIFPYDDTATTSNDKGSMVARMIEDNKISILFKKS